MRKIHINNVRSGAIIAKHIIDQNGRILLAAGTKFKNSYANKLKKLGIFELYIYDDMSEGIEITDAVKEQTRMEARVALQKVADDYMIKDKISIDQVRSVIDKIIDELTENNDILVNLCDIKTYDSYTFDHSVNVCILSMLTAIGLGYNKERTKELGVGAILHDIGKLKIPLKILNKPGRLTHDEFEEVKKHTIYGYEMLKKVDSISNISAYVALAHHERYNGTGYPLKKKGKDIHQSARIAAVSDVYDALTSNRVYRKRMPPNQALEYISAFTYQYFDYDVVKSFINNIAIYPVGTGVELSTGEKCLVVKNYKSMPMRPMVRVIYDSNNNKLKDFYEIDLTKKLNVFIINSCDID